MATNRLYRDTDNALLGGVCSGIGNRFAVDPTLVRIAVIALAVVTLGTTVLLYLALWIIVPAAPQPGSDGGNGEGSAHRPTKDELTREFRGAGDRITEAGRVVGRHAREAVDEISSMGRRPTSEPAGNEAAGAPAVNEAAPSDAPSPGADETRTASSESSTPPPPPSTPPSSSTPPQSMPPPSTPPQAPPGPWDPPRTP
ncbi:MAG: PspC domain-containing protein [Dehalococcoidia bacterium]|nr:PspC domain-containing protein [Dehalococcoidia bacterium]